MPHRQPESVNLNYVVRLLVVLLLTAATGAAQSRDTRTWYQAYRDAQTKIQQRDWQGALNDLDAATRAGAPRPGRNINFYGDTFATYNPEYYRGVALANLGRYPEADQAFERVKAANLIDVKDSSYNEFVRLSASVKDSVRQLAAQNARANAPAQSTSPAQNAAPAQTADATQTTPSAGAASGTTVPGGQPSSAQAPIQIANAPQPPNPTGVGVPGTAQGGSTPAFSPANAAPANPNGTKAPPAATKAPTTPLAPRPARNADTPAVASKAPAAPGSAKEERAGLFAFYSGDYAGAAQILRGLANAGSASPRALLYLASTEAALVLTGEWRAVLLERGLGSPADVMRDAQALVARVDTAPYARDLSLISPRIREQLGLRP